MQKGVPAEVVAPLVDVQRLQPTPGASASLSAEREVGVGIVRALPRFGCTLGLWSMSSAKWRNVFLMLAVTEGATAAIASRR